MDIIYGMGLKGKRLGEIRYQIGFTGSIPIHIDPPFQFLMPATEMDLYDSHRG